MAEDKRAWHDQRPEAASRPRLPLVRLKASRLGGAPVLSLEEPTKREDESGPLSLAGLVADPEPDRHPCVDWKRAAATLTIIEQHVFDAHWRRRVPKSSLARKLGLKPRQVTAALDAIPRKLREALPAESLGWAVRGGHSRALAHRDRDVFGHPWELARLSPAFLEVMQQEQSALFQTDPVAFRKSAEFRARLVRGGTGTDGKGEGRFVEHKLAIEVSRLEQREAELLHGIAAEQAAVKNREAAVAEVQRRINAELERAAEAGEKPARELMRDLREERYDLREDEDIHARIAVKVRALEATRNGLADARGQLAAHHIAELRRAFKAYRPRLLKSVEDFLGVISEMRQLSIDHGSTGIPLAWVFDQPDCEFMSPQQARTAQLLNAAYALAPVREAA